MNPRTCLVFLGLLVVSALAFNEDCFRTTPETLTAHGYACETHIVTTQDGYLLTVYRIPGKIGEPARRKQPVYMQPGIFCTSDVFVAGGVKKGMAYFLSDKGYDVWIANSRGTLYSRNHTKYTTKDQEFWNFTFEEQGLYDQPAVIEYIVSATGYPKVHFWSHSMGGTQMFAALTLDPEYYKKRIVSAVLTGPVIRFDLTTSLFIQFMNFTKLPDFAMRHGYYEFLGYTKSLSFFELYIKMLLPSIFKLMVRIIADTDLSVSDMERVDVFFSRFPAGSSSKCFKHLVQLTEAPGFFRYRETSDDPLVPYNISNLPDIHLAIFGGFVDELDTPEENDWLRDELRKAGKLVFMKNFPNIGHIPFMTPLDQYTGFMTEGLDFMRVAELEEKGEADE